MRRWTTEGVWFSSHELTPMGLGVGGPKFESRNGKRLGNNSYSQLMLTSVFDGAKWTTIAHSDLLLPQARAQQVECHYSHTQVENINSSRPHLPLFHLAKKKTYGQLGLFTWCHTFPSKLIANLTSWGKV